jgi:hypothetical protein
MSLVWMTATSVVVLLQELRPPRAAIDVPVALLVVAVGALTLLAPGAVPGLVT